MTRNTFLVLMAALFMTACGVGPHYRQSPPIPVAALFKEEPPEGFKRAQPGDALQKGKWWELYGDPVLNALEEQVDISNQNVLAAEATFRLAKAAVLVAR